jgi:hypothetical protein
MHSKNLESKSSNNNGDNSTQLSLRAPEGCVAICQIMMRLLRFTRNDIFYLWIWEKLKFSVSFYFLCITFILTLTLYSSLFAAIKDRVVAYVDNTAITLSELEKKYTETVHVTPAITKEEVLNTMINRVLLVREARKIRLKAQREDEMLREYVDLKIRAFIRIKDGEIKDFYDTHAADFIGKELDETREDIENYLIEQELNKRLKEHITELRNNACVKMQLNQNIRE